MVNFLLSYPKTICCMDVIIIWHSAHYGDFYLARFYCFNPFLHNNSCRNFTYLSADLDKLASKARLGFMLPEVPCLVRRLPLELNISCTSAAAESRAKIWYQWNAFKPQTPPPPPPPPPHHRWLRLLSILRRWLCCCWLFVYCYSHCGSL